MFWSAAKLKAIFLLSLISVESTFLFGGHWYRRREDPEEWSNFGYIPGWSGFLEYTYSDSRSNGANEAINRSSLAPRSNSFVQ